ncbi:DUF4399 domain-containing protein [Halalkalicoccus subterraneus]|uniref:DUF4399 domain-containing protein n=1 Tax=Halalkalicoccus subterraneus TaxID=2675002 RepID=UPI000EFB9FA6|nr:DUF4399 domain-containing protein [Halalkalicoccus subterraneus]
MQQDVSRRGFIVGTATGVAAASVAGCTQSESDETEENGSTDDNGSAADEPSVPEDASVSLSVPTADELDGLYTPLVAFFEAENFTVEEAGEVNEGAGHFHVLIDTEQIEPGETIPNDDQHLHFGDGSERGVLDLEPGEHELTLQMGNGEHVALSLTDTQSVTVDGAGEIGLDAPQDGATFSTGETITFEPSVENVVLEEAGEVTQNAGHHHVLIDTDPVDTGTVIPTDDQHLHFGDGTETPEVDASDLEVGEHDVLVQVANGVHEAYPLATDPITITVEE